MWSGSTKWTSHGYLRATIEAKIVTLCKSKVVSCDVLQIVSFSSFSKLKYICNGYIFAPALKISLSFRLEEEKFEGVMRKCSNTKVCLKAAKKRSKERIEKLQQYYLTSIFITSLENYVIGLHVRLSYHLIIRRSGRKTPYDYEPFF